MSLIYLENVDYVSADIAVLRSSVGDMFDMHNNFWHKILSHDLTFNYKEQDSSFCT